MRRFVDRIRSRELGTNSSHTIHLDPQNEDVRESRHNPFQYLPNEVFEKITKHLSPSDTSRLNQVDLHLRERTSVAVRLYKLLQNGDHEPQEVMDLLGINQRIPDSLFVGGVLSKSLFYRWLCDRYHNKMMHDGINVTWIREKFTQRNLRDVLKEVYLDLQIARFCFHYGISYEELDFIPEDIRNGLMRNCKIIDDVSTDIFGIARELEHLFVYDHMVIAINKSDMFFQKDDLIKVINLALNNPDCTINSVDVIMKLMEKHDIKLYECPIILSFLYRYSIHSNGFLSHLKTLCDQDFIDYYRQISFYHQVLEENKQYLSYRTQLDIEKAMEKLDRQRKKRKMVIIPLSIKKVDTDASVVSGSSKRQMCRF